MVIDLTTPRQVCADGIRIYRNSLSRLDVIKHNPVTVTTPIRTMIDLASVLDQDRLEDCLEEGLYGELFDLPDLGTRIAELDRRGRKGIANLCRLLEMSGPIGVSEPNHLRDTPLSNVKKCSAPAADASVLCLGQVGGRHAT